MGGMAEVIARYNPGSNTLADQAKAAEIADTQALTQQRQAGIPLTQQQVIGAQLTNAQAQRDLHDQQILSDAWQQSGGDQTKLLGLAMKNGASPKAIFGLQASIIGHQKDVEALQKEQLENRGALLKQYTGGLEGVQAAPADQKQAAWDAFSQEAVQSGAAKPGELPPQYPGDDWVAIHRNAGLVHGQILEETSKKQEDALKAAQQAQAEAATKKTLAEIPGLQAQGAITQRTLDAMRSMNPVTLNDQIDRTIPAAKGSPYAFYNTAAKQAVQGMISSGAMPEKIQEAIQSFAKEAGIYQAKISGETDPNVIAAKVRQSVAEAAAKEPIETKRALEVAATNRGNAGADKLDTEYNQARTATESLGKILDLAESGNKAAGSNLPLVGVETVNAINGIKRINSAEINQYGNAGSLLDEIKGKLGKLVAGQPIPKDVLSDIRELHQSLGEQAYEKYTSGLKALGQRSGTDLPPTLPAPNIRKAGGGPGTIFARDEKGQLHQAPAGTALPKGWKMESR